MMIETFSDLAKLLDDGWRITGIRADSDGDRQRFRFEVEAVKCDAEPWRGPAWILECGCDNFIEHCEQCDARRAMKRNAITPEGWEIGSGFAEFLHSVGHGNLDTELRDLEDAR